MNRLFNEQFFITLAKDMIYRLDNHYGHKIHFIAMSASNFSGRSNYKTYSILQYDSDRKYAALDSRLMTIREKYGVDIIRYGRELIV